MNRPFEYPGLARVERVERLTAAIVIVLLVAGLLVLLA